VLPGVSGLNEAKMRGFKIVGLGLLFSILGTIGLIILGVIPVTVDSGPSHATGVGAILGALEHATLYNPYYWLGIIVAFFAAFWFVRHKRNA
jgi:hypothetical protein